MGFRRPGWRNTTWHAVVTWLSGVERTRVGLQDAPILADHEGDALREAQDGDAHVVGSEYLARRVSH